MNQILDVCESTQKIARENWEMGRAQLGYWVCSLEQTAGRGRRGNQWISNRGNFFFSIILPEPEQQQRITWSAMMGALAVARAIPEFSIKLKWPNDLYLGDAKCGGVLAERAGGALILGVGINLVDEPVLKDRNTVSLGGAISPEVLCIRVLKELELLWPVYTNGDESQFSLLVAEFNSRSFFARGDALRWISGAEEFEGKMDHLGTFGELIVKLPTGLSKSLYSEDVFGVRSSHS